MKQGAFIVGRQGDGATEIFSGESKNTVVEKMYGESAPYFAEIIRNFLVARELSYEILDIGTFRGELLSKVITELGEQYRFNKTGIDLEKDALVGNNNLDEKILGDAADMPFSDKAFDVVLCRYVLQWNNVDRQKQIISELQRVNRGFVIIQHAGSGDEDADEWKEKIHELVFGGVPKVSRAQGYFSSPSEIERWMEELNISFKRLQYRRLDGLSSVFAEKYKLTKEEENKVSEILGDKNYIYQTTWIVGEKAIS